MKIRADFVTNSSSSSFTITIKVKTNNDDIMALMVEGEEEELYRDVYFSASPKQLGSASSIDEMIQMIKAAGTLEDDDEDEDSQRRFFDKEGCDSYFVINGRKSHGKAEKFFDTLKKIPSMDEVASITISGEEGGWDCENFFESYTYELASGKYTGV